MLRRETMSTESMDEEIYFVVTNFGEVLMIHVPSITVCHRVCIIIRNFTTSCTLRKQKFLKKTQFFKSFLPNIRMTDSLRDTKRQ